VDGLPTLKVQTLTEEGISEHRRCKTSPDLLNIQHMREARAPKPLTLPKINYAQILLEEEDNVCSDDVVVKRVLIWKPGLKKHQGVDHGVVYKESTGPDSAQFTIVDDRKEESVVRESASLPMETKQPTAKLDGKLITANGDGDLTSAKKSPKPALRNTLKPYCERHKANQVGVNVLMNSALIGVPGC
jgi:hypothetical protein